MPIGWPWVGSLSELLHGKCGRICCHLGVARRRRIDRQRGRLEPQDSGVANRVGRKRVCRPGRHLLRLHRVLDWGVGGLRACKPRVGNRGLARDTRADTQGRPCGELLPWLSKQKAEYRVRVGLGWGLLGTTRTRCCTRDEQPQCCTATCLGPRRCRFLWQRPCAGLGGHRHHQEGIDEGETR